MRTEYHGISWRGCLIVPCSCVFLIFFAASSFFDVAVGGCGPTLFPPNTWISHPCEVLRTAAQCPSIQRRTLKNMVDLLQTYVMSIQVSLASRGWNSSIPDVLDLQAMKNLFPSILCTASACTSAFQSTHLRI